jgi:hypothetical protein
MQQSFDEHGYTLIPTLLDKDQYREIKNIYDEESFFDARLICFIPVWKRGVQNIFSLFFSRC